MWLRLAHKPTIIKGSTWLLSVLGLFLLMACEPSGQATVDELNNLSYACHYRNLDSTAYYARKAYVLSEHNDAGRAEALNNLAFVNIMHMQYDDAKRQLDSIIELSDNYIEVLIANIQNMRLCQRRSRNREFYNYRESALQALRRINEERSSLNERQLARVFYAETELAIVTSTYYYYVGRNAVRIRLHPHRPHPLHDLPAHGDQPFKLARHADALEAGS